MALEALTALERRLSALPPCVTDLQQLKPSWPPAGSPGPVDVAEWAYDPTFPIAVVGAYLASKIILDKLCAALGTTGASAGFTLLCFAHNVALAVFSMVTWFRSWAIVYSSVQQVGLHDTYCASPNNPLMQNGLAFYTSIFYLSKYYEFIDTFILIVKRKHVMLLQTYHHSGAVYAMYLLSATQAPSALWFVCMNSFIHTLMYSYYAASVYKESSVLTSGLYSLLLPLKPYLTRMQICQVRAAFALICNRYRIIVLLIDGRPCCLGMVSARSSSLVCSEYCHSSLSRAAMLTLRRQPRRRFRRSTSSR